MRVFQFAMQMPFWCIWLVLALTLVIKPMLADENERRRAKHDGIFDLISSADFDSVSIKGMDPGIKTMFSKIDFTTDNKQAIEVLIKSIGESTVDINSWVVKNESVGLTPVAEIKFKRRDKSLSIYVYYQGYNLGHTPWSNDNAFFSPALTVYLNHIFEMQTGKPLPINLYSDLSGQSKIENQTKRHQENLKKNLQLFDGSKK